MIDIREIRSSEAQAAKQVMFDVCAEVWGDTEEQTLQYDLMLDYQRLPESFSQNGGIFLVALDGEKVVGSGGIRRYQDQIAEIKRMWLLNAYRGQGVGKEIIIKLIHYAMEAGFERIWLEVASPELQPEALGLYTRLGFHPIPRYTKSVCELAMEKILG